MLNFYLYIGYINYYVYFIYFFKITIYSIYPKYILYFNKKLTTLLIQLFIPLLTYVND